MDSIECPQDEIYFVECERTYYCDYLVRIEYFEDGTYRYVYIEYDPKAMDYN